MAGLTRLPPALQPWAPELEAFPAPLAASLQAPLRRLASMIGPLSVRQRPGDGEPDGFDGLTRRGPYHRLLLSEWAVGMFMPTEFLRRAVDKEHGFLQLRRVSPVGSRRILVLCDPGPSQHGEPRIAQLAALIILASRARRSDLSFSWALLTDSTLHHTLDKGSIAAFRTGAHAQSGSAADLQRWRLELEVQADDDFWVLGGPTMLELGAPSTLVIRDQAEPGAHELSLELHRNGVRRMSLPVPPPDDCVRVFRMPLVGSAPKTPSPTPLGTGSLWFSVDGHRLLHSDAEGITAIHVPNSPKAAMKTPRGQDKTWNASGVIGAGVWRRSVVGVRRVDRGLVNHHGDLLHQSDAFIDPPQPRLCIVQGGELAMIDGHQDLWLLRNDRPSEVIMSGVIALSESTVVSHDRGETWQSGWGKRLTKPTKLASFEAQVRLSTCVAVQKSDIEWAIRTQTQTTLLRALPDHHVVGAVCDTDDGWARKLVLLAPDQRRILLKHADVVEVLVASAHTILSVALAPHRNQVAWQTERGDVRVIDLQSRTIVVDIEGP